MVAIFHAWNFYVSGLHKWTLTQFCSTVGSISCLQTFILSTDLDSKGQGKDFPFYLGSVEFCIRPMSSLVFFSMYVQKLFLLPSHSSPVSIPAELWPFHYPYCLSSKCFYIPPGVAHPYFHFPCTSFGLLKVTQEVPVQSSWPLSMPFFLAYWSEPLTLQENLPCPVISLYIDNTSGTVVNDILEGWRIWLAKEHFAAVCYSSTRWLMD